MNELYNEIMNGNIDYVKNYYNTNGTSEINQDDDEGFTPLEIAVDQGQLEIIKFLIKKGADVNVHDTNENDYDTPPTALVIACNNFENEPYLYIKIIILLIEHGAKLTQKDPKTHRTARDILRNSLEQLNINVNKLNNLNDLKKIESSVNIIKKHWNIHKQHQLYKPGGKGYYEAHSHFNQLRNSSFGNRNIDREVRRELRKEIERIIKNNNELSIYCENNEEQFKIKFNYTDLIVNNKLKIRYLLDLYFVDDNEDTEDDEKYQDHLELKEDILGEIQESTIEFIKENKAYNNVQIKKNGILIFSGESYKRMIYNRIKNYRKRETGMLHFGKKRTNNLSLKTLRLDLKKVSRC